jgi:hypothetical protein
MLSWESFLKKLKHHAMLLHLIAEQLHSYSGNSLSSANCPLALVNPMQ